MLCKLAYHTCPLIVVVVWFCDMLVNYRIANSNARIQNETITLPYKRLCGYLPIRWGVLVALGFSDTQAPLVVAVYSDFGRLVISAAQLLTYYDSKYGLFRHVVILCYC